MSIAVLNGWLRQIPPWVIYVVGIVPLAILGWQALSGRLGVDPVKELEHQLGKYGLQLLIAGLMVTPIRRFTGLNLIRFRRAIGLLAFLYVCLHLATWLLLDLQLRWAEIGADLVKRPYVVLGMGGFLALLPLAATSNDAAVRYLGSAAWQRLHKLTYAAALLGAAHYLLLVKGWQSEPLVYMLVAASLVTLRLAWRRGRVAKVTA